MPKVFVYGAQMIHPDSLGAGWAARVEDHAVRFVTPGLPIFEPVFASLVPEPGATAHGVIVDFDETSWQRLVALEVSYEVHEVHAVLLDPEHARELGVASLACPAFVLPASKRTRSEGRPSARYAAKLAAGARAHGLPREVVDRYERAQAEGGRASLALAWLFPIASRIGLVTTAILLGVILLGLIACVALWLTP